jgi:hypothetical protein
MITKLDEINPTKDEPFKYCILKREKYAEILTSIINNSDSGFVLAINNKWGSGKTTFVKMWEKHLEKEGFKTVFFNAWENDHEKEPLVAILAVLKNLFQKNKVQFDALIKKGAKLFTSSLPILGKALIKNYVGSDIVSKAGEKILDSAEKLFHSEVDHYYRKQEHLTTFKKALSTFIQKSNNGKPLIFFIDELDRCRPDFAVEILEKIKHFFAIKEIIFVLSIDKEQLGYGIQGYYGSNKIDYNGYLKRFIDLEYSIPEPAIEDYCNYLMGQFGIGDFFTHDWRTARGDFSGDTKNFLDIAILIANKNKMSLRDIEKLFAETGIILKGFRLNNYVIPRLFFFLIFAKSYHPEFYKKISKLEFSHQELIDEFEIIIKPWISEFSYNGVHPLAHIEALLMVFYNNCLPRDQMHKFYEKDENGKYTNLINSQFFNHEIPKIYESIKNNDSIGDIEMRFFIEKIDLTQPFVN